MSRRVALIILDGWGHRSSSVANAIHAANTPTWDQLWRDNPHALLDASGPAVGLPAGQMGNSEVGHLTIGAGRVIDQDLARINRKVDDGSIAELPAVRSLLNCANDHFHILALLSPGGVHSHEDHVEAVIRSATKHGKAVFLHAVLDGRDTPPQSAGASLEKFDALFQELGNGCISSISGRYFAMDRDRRWERTERAYRLLTESDFQSVANSAIGALKDSYSRDITDEFVEPTRIQGGKHLRDGDSLFCMNFRADRMRQICETLISPSFAAFQRKSSPKLNQMVFMAPYRDDLDAGTQATPVSIAFEAEPVIDSLAHIIAAAGKRQVRLAETEKYAHVTFFFSGGQETEFIGESRVFVKSPKVPTYDLEPSMSSAKLTHKIVDVIKESSNDLIVANFANGDMVGHTGNFEAAKSACEAVDQSLSKISSAAQQAQMDLLITADHGNVECMRDPAISGQPHTAHTLSLVPLVLQGDNQQNLKAKGTLADVAPTVLELMGLDVPKVMTGNSLLN